MVRKVLIESGINYVEVANEAAFYGPNRQCRLPTGRAGTSPCPLVAVRKDFGLDLPRQGQLEQDAVVHPSRAARHA